MFLYGHWMKLPLSTRQAIAVQFGIIKKGSTEVFDNQVKSDGYVIADVEAALGIDAIQKWTGSESTDFQVLWDMMVAKAEGKDKVAPPITTGPAGPTGPKPFCDICDSKGVRHKKACPKYVPTTKRQ